MFRNVLIFVDVSGIVQQTVFSTRWRKPDQTLKCPQPRRYFHSERSALG